MSDQASIDRLRRFTRHGHTSVARVKQHGDHVRQMRDGGGVVPRETGEPLTFPDSQTRIRMGVMFDLDHPDLETRKAGIRRFRKSVYFKLFSPYQNRQVVVQ